MKQLTITLGLLLLLCNITWAQKKMKEGIVRYYITDIHTDVPEMEMMKGSQMTLYFSDKKQKVEMNLMDGAYRTQTIFSEDSNESIILTDIMGKKVRINEVKEEVREDLNIQKVIYDKDKVKEIAGYSCHKAILNGKNGDRLVAYVTNRITPKNSYFEDLFMGLEGFPLEYTIINNQVAITFTAEEVSHKIDDSVFFVLGDYESMTEEQFREMMGGLSLGF